jgi:hypothetical protein
LDSNNGALSINATGGAIRIGNDADNQAIQIGQGGTRTITIGTSNAPVTIGGDLVVTGATVSTSSATPTDASPSEPRAAAMRPEPLSQTPGS